MDQLVRQSDTLEVFIQRWHGVTASELATAQSFVIELCALLGVDKPHPTADQSYMFERPLKEAHGDGSQSDRRVDCYKRGHFILEAKRLNAGRHTKGYDNALLAAHAQAQNYARALPAAEGRPPFIMVVDVGSVIQLFSEFSRSGGNYVPFPDPRSHQIKLQDLRDEKVRERLRLLWTDPMALDPGRANAQVTREVATVLAAVAKSLEADGHKPEAVGAFLTRCLFSMFAEDVQLLPPPADGSDKGVFSALLKAHRDNPPVLCQMLKHLWQDMDQGGFSAALARQILKFNGKLFKDASADSYTLPLKRAQIDQLLQAANADWTAVEPAIFGTLLERALDPTERHALGAHYTPRAYVERLILPTVMEPLRAEWSNTLAAALVLAGEAAEATAQADTLADALAQRQALQRDVKSKVKNELDAVDKLHASARAKQREAVAAVKAFHHRLCTVRVLDPACGSGNFLYVTLEHLKRLEGEVLNQLELLDTNLRNQKIEGETVTLQQLRGIELNPRAAALAELVLWIGYLQWQARTVGVGNIAEPVVHDYGNIENRDAVLACERMDWAMDASGQAITRWDGVTFKPHPVTGLPVPDERAQKLQELYVKPRKAAWPQVDFIVGNPPFIGASTMRASLGDGYVDALRSTWPDVPESADFVMYWWHHAAQTVGAGQAQRFGFITTNSIKQTFNRRVVQAALDAETAGAGSAGGLMLPNAQKSAAGTARPRCEALSLIFAIADHPWVDSTNGAAVRIAMTTVQAGAHEGRLLTVQSETSQDDGEVAVGLSESRGLLHADLRIGANVAAARALRANLNLSNRGVQLFSAGFIVTRSEAAQLGLGKVPGLEQHIREYRNGRDLTAAPRDVMVIDLFGLNAEETRLRFPAVYQWLLEKVKPERDQNNRDSRRKFWWLFGETNPKLRQQLQKLPRYISTVETAKHRVFQFLDGTVLPDNKLVAIAVSEAMMLGVLSSSVHLDWTLAAGSTLEDRPVYVKTTCFETFPFPSKDTGLTPALTERIRALAEQLDAHRKKQQVAHPELTLTGMYNVLEKLRSGEALNAKDKTLHEQGLVSVLRTLHDELDAAVLAAYGWTDLGPAPSKQDEAAHPAWTDALLQRLVDLNTRRAAEEAAGTIRWLRPEFQNPALRDQASQAAQAHQGEMAMPEQEEETTSASGITNTAIQPWPNTLGEQINAVTLTLKASPQAINVDHIAAQFKGKGRWKERLPTILETLVVIGRAQTDGRNWRGI